MERVHYVPYLNTFPHDDSIFPSAFKCKGQLQELRECCCHQQTGNQEEKQLSRTSFFSPFSQELSMTAAIVSPTMTNRGSWWNQRWNDACPSLLDGWLLRFPCVSHLHQLLYCSHIDYMTSQVWVEWSAAISWLFQTDQLTYSFVFLPLKNGMKWHRKTAILDEKFRHLGSIIVVFVYLSM